MNFSFECERTKNWTPKVVIRANEFSREFPKNTFLIRNQERYTIGLAAEILILNRVYGQRLR